MLAIETFEKFNDVLWDGNAFSVRSNDTAATYFNNLDECIGKFQAGSPWYANGDLYTTEGWVNVYFFLPLDAQIVRKHMRAKCVGDYAHHLPSVMYSTQSIGGLNLTDVNCLIGKYHPDPDEDADDD